MTHSRLLFILVEWALIFEVVISRHDDDSDSVVILLLFSSAWSELVLLYCLIFPIYLPQFSNTFACLALESSTAILWSVGAISVAGDIRDKQWRFKQALTAVSFYMWAIFTYLAVYAGMSLIRSRREAQIKGNPRLQGLNVGGGA